MLDLGTAVAALFVVGGALALGVGLGGGRLPRCDPDVSRIALRAGGVAALALGIAIGIDRLAGL